MNGTTVSVVFFLDNNEIEESVNINNCCEKNEDGSYKGTFDGTECIFNDIDSFAQVLYDGFMQTIGDYYNFKLIYDPSVISKNISKLQNLNIPSTTIAIGNLIIPIEKINGIKVEPVYFPDEIPEENMVTVQELD